MWLPYQSLPRLFPDAVLMCVHLQSVFVERFDEATGKVRVVMGNGTDPIDIELSHLVFREFGGEMGV